jgi:hypothetical protein
VDTSPDFNDPQAAKEVAEAINVMTADILKNTPKLYPKGHPVDDLPSAGTEIERHLKRGKIAEAKRRAGIAEKYLEMYSPSEEAPVAAKKIIAKRIHDLVHTG